LPVSNPYRNSNVSTSEQGGALCHLRLVSLVNWLIETLNPKSAPGGYGRRAGAGRSRGGVAMDTGGPRHQKPQQSPVPALSDRVCSMAEPMHVAALCIQTSGDRQPGACPSEQSRRLAPSRRYITKPSARAYKELGSRPAVAPGCRARLALRRMVPNVALGLTRIHPGGKRHPKRQRRKGRRHRQAGEKQ
jgi:hypothetical protein